MNERYSHLHHIQSRDELALYELIPNIVWIFDLDRHGWWWGNAAAIKFWNLTTLDELIAKDLSDDTQGARDRTLQTFEMAAKEGLTVDNWTTYPKGKPKTLHMMHRAVLVGPEKHRAIIAYINEEVNLGTNPENLILAEAMLYTTVLVTSFTMKGERVISNPASSAAYSHIDANTLPGDQSVFAARFADPQAGKACLERAIVEKGGRWDYLMRTSAGLKTHTLDIRQSRHPLTGEYLLLVSEYDITPLLTALESANKAHEELKRIAHYDALTGLPSLHLFQENMRVLQAQAERTGQQLAVMFMDLDRFKAVNDTFGHSAGDTVLKEVATRLTRAVRQPDHVARIGGDEFILLQTNFATTADIITVAQKVIRLLEIPFNLCTGTAQISASIGIALFPDDGADSESLIKAADKSMYKVKKSGKNGYQFSQ